MNKLNIEDKMDAENTKLSGKLIVCSVTLSPSQPKFLEFVEAFPGSEKLAL